MGVGLVAISPQLREKSVVLTETQRIGFEILHDEGNRVAGTYGLRYALPDYLIETYRAIGIDLVASNGDASWSLPLPARFVIDASETIRYDRVSADYRFRPEPTETFEAVKAMLEQGPPSTAKG